VRPVQKLLKFLQSLWGSLATAAVLFPGAAALLKVRIAPAHSGNKEFYAIAATIFAAFALLMQTTFVQELARLRTARRVAILGGVAAVACFFSLLVIRGTFLDVVTRTRQLEIVGHDSIVVQIVHDSGVVHVGRSRFTSDTSRLATLAASEYSKGDPWDVVGLSLFCGAVVGFTVAFGALGINAYAQRPEVQQAVGAE
jgi:hypothetical protein